jgi:hypothetical protein
MGARASPGPDGGRGLTPAYAGGITGVRRWGAYGRRVSSVARCANLRFAPARLRGSLALRASPDSPTPHRLSSFPAGRSPRSRPACPGPTSARAPPSRPRGVRRRSTIEVRSGSATGGARSSRPAHRVPATATRRRGGGRRSGRRGEGSDGRDRDPQQRGRDIGTYARRRIAGAPACGEARHEPQDEEDKHHAGDVPRHGQQQRPLEPPPGPPTDPHLAPDGPPCLNGGPAAGMLRREDFPFKDRSREAGKGVRTNVARLRALPHPRPGVLPVRTPIASEEPG